MPDSYDVDRDRHVESLPLTLANRVWSPDAGSDLGRGYAQIAVQASVVVVGREIQF